MGFVAIWFGVIRLDMFSKRMQGGAPVYES